MFIIKPEKSVDWQNAMFMLSYYSVKCELYSDGENDGSIYMVVDSDVDDQIRMAEMAFQMNWHQEGGMMLCPHCDKDVCNTCKDQYSDKYPHCINLTCGHLTFTKPII